MALYSYIVCEKHYQESNSPIIPLKKGLQTYYLRKERGLKGKDLFRKGRIRHGSTR